MAHQSPASPQVLDDILLPEVLPPLVTTAFTRPDLLEPVLVGLQKQSLLPPKIIAFVDAPRDADEAPKVQKTVQLLEDFAATIPTQIIQRSHNLGCDQNVILGFTEVFEQYDALVYLEDDDLPNICFYDCMCKLLEAYRDYENVFSVSSYAPWAGTTDADFIASNRIFSWGFGIWADRWKKMNLKEKPGRYNPFGEFYKIPANSQTKLTILSQFWLERSNRNRTDWVITTTLMALSMDAVHIVPTQSFVKNIGFGHAESETQRGQEKRWVNAKYNPEFIPQKLTFNFSLAEEVQKPLSGVDLAQFFRRKGIWLTPHAVLFLLGKYLDLGSWLAFLQLFVLRMPRWLKRWRAGLKT